MGHTFHFFSFYVHREGKDKKGKQALLSNTSAPGMGWSLDDPLETLMWGRGF